MMRFRLFMNCSATGYAFGMWQASTNWTGALWAGLFVFLLLGAFLSMIDYAKQPLQSVQTPNERSGDVNEIGGAPT